MYSFLNCYCPNFSFLCLTSRLVMFWPPREKVWTLSHTLRHVRTGTLSDRRRGSVRLSSNVSCCLLFDLSVEIKMFNPSKIKPWLSYLFVLVRFSVGLKAKIESDRLIVSVGKKPPQETGIKVKNHSSLLSLAHRRDFKQLLQGITGEGPLRLADMNFKEFAGFQIALPNKVGVRQQQAVCSVANQRFKEDP